MQGLQEQLLESRRRDLELRSAAYRPEVEDAVRRYRRRRRALVWDRLSRWAAGRAEHARR